MLHIRKEQMLSLLVLMPLILLILLNLPFKYRRDSLAFWSSGALFTAQALLVLLHQVVGLGSRPDPLVRFFAFQLSLDNLALAALFTVGLIAFVSLLVGSSTITRESSRFNFVNLLLISVLGMNATVLTRDIFSLYVCIELSAVAVFVLMAVEKNKFAIEGTFKYLVLSILASIFMLTSVAFFILAAQSTAFGAIHAAFSKSSNLFLLDVAVGLFLCGALIKSGVVPFHGWVPDAYSEAHSAVSVLLAGIVTKISGIYVLIRVCTSVFLLNPHVQSALMVIGLLSIVLAALAAFTQDDIKRLLSYSSISQIGYIVLAVGCGTPLAIIGAVYHFFNHAVFKSLLFVNAASLEKKFGSTDMMIISGLGYHLPVTRLTFVLGFLSCSGLPPLAGFWSKLIIIIALFASGRPFFGAVAALSSVLTLAYFLVLERNVFFIKIETPLEDKTGVPFAMKFCEVLLAALTIAAGIGVGYILNNWKFS